MTQIVVAIKRSSTDRRGVRLHNHSGELARSAVRGSVDHSLLIGEQVTEEFVVGGTRKLRVASDPAGGALPVDDHDKHPAGPSRNRLPTQGARRKHPLRT